MRGDQASASLGRSERGFGIWQAWKLSLVSLVHYPFPVQSLLVFSLLRTAVKTAIAISTLFTLEQVAHVFTSDSPHRCRKHVDRPCIRIIEEGPRCS